MVFSFHSTTVFVLGNRRARVNRNFARQYFSLEQRSTLRVMNELEGPPELVQHFRL
jgi:hypothetical protein